MLYFSKIRIIVIFLLIIIFSFFTFSNFFSSENSYFKKKINLGLDLQGGSYLLLEIDNKPVITEILQNKVFEFKKFFKDKNIKIGNFKVENGIIEFTVEKNKVEDAIDLLDDDDSLINPYYQDFKSHQFEFTNNENKFSLNLSKHGIINIKNSSLDQSIEIVRKRVDEIGTNEPNILKRGNDRILVELPGLDNPDRIKSLLGKTANLTFQFITANEEESFGTEKLFSEDDSEEVVVSKRIIISGENLLDAKPHMDTLNNETVVLFTLDRVGAK